ncbi:MAG: hypothetical protein JW726_18840 [Anaerolineales bacterium]|nr:hypothetical protein [Anaerolineales bacterium]
MFIFLRDKDLFPQKEGSPVLILEKITSGPAGLGTHYREVVQMFPFVRGEIFSQVTRFEPPEWLAEDFSGAGMTGHLEYQFLPEKDGTRLIQRQALHMQGMLQVFTPVVRWMLGRQLKKRLEEIRRYLDAEGSGNA